jgi:ubiquinone/menaquinone biosynthesis C-methylase UbiE
MDTSSERFNKITSNFVTSEVHKSSPTLARLHELLHGSKIKTVCDVACGAGHLGLSFIGSASRFVAVDPAPNMLAAASLLAQEKGVALEVHNSAAENLPLADEEFDLTASRLAPHHFHDVCAAVGEMVRVTKRHGVVAVIDLEGNEDKGYDDFNHQLEILHDPTHVRSYTANRWRRIFQEAGLVIEAFEPEMSERPAGVPVKRWCEIASSGEVAEQEINRLLRHADRVMLDALGIGKSDEVFLMPIRTVLILGSKRD